MQLTVGKVYQLNFMDPEQPDYTWFTGQGVFSHEDTEDYDTGEQHYCFVQLQRAAGDVGLAVNVKGETYSFPKSSISIPV